MFVPL